mmetsp:Transcript_33384/g.34010  ORF Transcript_33384/g.34010 Transcript_33384/m.34010 type:complete len:353 (+) Transcript_33384:390-1448(+)|eukprot:CAMPEP_0182423902 /NCGR_PEP_ID=MMETSP1167-20130531/9988_1 /TAXON_ID=2988 /ORGANISM="Mallomonas Sp, Strain CCMP3275" /LENGTH=352 /DNA_ID=CAMNT_0024603247 /DNA_START=380 /DNA_END=1438 /DNA_ORIENTATION=+
MIIELICTLLVSISLIGVKSQAYREGYFNSMDNMPGSLKDSRNLPSLPFSTDTNRYSDGTTSKSIYSVTSPHFPYYNGSLVNITDRAKYYINYIQSASEQGIGITGDGDAVIEDAKFKITNQKKEFPRPNVTFPVYAALKWNPSGFAIQVGEIYRIDVFGEYTGFGSQFWNDGGIRVDANGYDSYYDPISNCHVALGRCRSHLKKRRRLPGANWMALACAVGLFVRPVFTIVPGAEQMARYVPLDEAAVQESVFHVGTSFQFRANNTGELICFANDAHTLYWNNYGFLQVTVTRVSWPPSNETYYQSLYLPSCDSSNVVYSQRSIPCNSEGGGGGWSEEEINNSGTKYGSSL